MTSHDFIEKHAVMFSDATCVLRGITPYGVEVFVPVSTDDPIPLRDEFQRLLTGASDESVSQ